MSEDKIFIDTNIIIYAYDVTAEKKHRIASEIISALWNSGSGMVSTQVLQEFFVNVVQKIPKPLDPRQAQEIVRDFLKWQVVIPDGVSLVESIEICLRYGYSLWDSMIIEAAARGWAAIIYSEDLQDGQVISGITIKNPFR